MAKAVQGVTGLLPNSRTKPGRRTSVRGAKGPAGLLVLAGAAGLALKNRDKLGSLMSRKDDEPTPAALAPTSASSAERHATDTAPPSTESSPSPPTPP